MTNIKILDCTLRDGGYINNWEFGSNNIKDIIANLHAANIDYIETGFLKEGLFNSSQSLYSSFNDISKNIPDAIESNFFTMIEFGTFPIEKIPSAETTPIKGIRLIFKKHQQTEALEFCKKVIDKGFELMINPTFINSYSNEEFISIINKINTIKPYGMTLVDSMGALKESELLNLYNLIEQNLAPSLSLGFHSHNNLRLSFSNAQTLMKIKMNRELIIDSSVFGMGRGAGNICTELLTQYLNDNYNGKYNTVPILKTVDEIIHPIFKNKPWGYSVQYFLAAINHCHPNYAKYLIDKSVAVDNINQLLTAIPKENKSIYRESVIEEIYSDYTLKHCAS